MPPEAVPERLRSAVTKLIADWDYSWDDVTFAGTVSMPEAERSVLEPIGGPELWVFAISAEMIDVGDALEITAAAVRPGWRCRPTRVV